MQQKKNVTNYGDLFSRFYNIRGLVFGVLFLAYMWFLHPIVLGFVVQARTTGRPFVFVGAGIVLVQILELPGIWLKRPAVKERIRRWPSESFAAQFGVGVSQLSHIFLSMMVFLHVMPLFGIEGLCFDYATRPIPCLLTNVAFIAVLAKEMVAFFLVLDIQKPVGKANMGARPMRIREVLGEVLLLSFGALTFTLSWSAIMTFIDPVTDENWWVGLVSSLILLGRLLPTSRLAIGSNAAGAKPPSCSQLLLLTR